MTAVTSPSPTKHGARRLLAWSLTLLSLAVIACFALGTGIVEAQSTGGSFGGGDWGGGGGGGGGSYGGGGGSSDHDGSAFFLIELVFIAFRIHPLFGVLVLVIGVGVLIARGTASSRSSDSTRRVNSNDTS